MQSSPSFATVAEYFRLGLQIGMITPEQASAWASSVIAALENPPYEIIEVSWSHGVAATLEALSAVPGERDRKFAGCALLGLLKNSIPKSDDGLQLAVHRAMQIARDAELGDEIYSGFDVVDDELSLALTKVYGNVEKCRKDLFMQLAEYHALVLPSGI